MFSKSFKALLILLCINLLTTDQVVLKSINFILSLCSSINFGFIDGIIYMQIQILKCSYLMLMSLIAATLLSLVLLSVFMSICLTLM